MKGLSAQYLLDVLSFHVDFAIFLVGGSTQLNLGIYLSESLHTRVVFEG